MSTKRTTMQDIADMIGITKVSVSKAINNQDGIGEKLRIKILETAEKLNYIKPTGNNKSTSKTFLFIAPVRCFAATEQFYSTIYFKLSEYCNSHNTKLVLALVDEENENNGIMPSVVADRSFDGCFIEGEMNVKFQKTLSNLGIPMITIDYYSQFLDADCVITDNYNIGYIATEYLISQGHTDIGFIGGFGMTSSITDRIFGYKRALIMHNIIDNDEWIIKNNDALTNTYTVEFDLPEKMPTAFVCHCDLAAYILIKRLSMAGLNVPNDVSVISIDNTDLAKTCSPPLTTVDIPLDQFAIMSYNALTKRMGNINKDLER